MTWGEFKKRCEEIGLQDSDEIAFDRIDNRGLAYYKNSNYHTKFTREVPRGNKAADA